MVNSVPSGKFAVAFCEASGACRIRVEGNDNDMKKLAEINARNIGAGHSFIVFTYGKVIRLLKPESHRAIEITIKNKMFKSH